MCTALAAFQGQLYAALDLNANGGGTARVMVRATTGTWSASDSGTVSAGAYDNGYTTLKVWPPEDGSVTSPTSALFAVRRHITGDAGVGALRKFNGSSWSTVHTWNYDTTGTSRIESTYSINSSNTPVPTLWLGGGANLLPNSTDGTTWTDRWSTLTSGAQTVGVSAGFTGAILQVSR